jgi:hypothetical protein
MMETEPRIVFLQRADMHSTAQHSTSQHSTAQYFMSFAQSRLKCHLQHLLLTSLKQVSDGVVITLL